MKWNILDFLLQKHNVQIAIDTWVNIEWFWIGLRGSKIALESPKMKKWPKNKKNSKTDILEQFLRIRYSVSMNFIDVLKKTCMLEAKNVKPQYANEIKVQIFKISKNHVNTPKIESAQYK